MKYNSSENYKHTANYLVPRQQEELSRHLNEFFRQTTQQLQSASKNQVLLQEQELKELQTHC